MSDTKVFRFRCPHCNNWNYFDDGDKTFTCWGCGLMMTTKEAKLLKCGAAEELTGRDLEKLELRLRQLAAIKFLGVSDGRMQTRLPAH